MAEIPWGKHPLDKKIKALAKLNKTRAGKRLIKDHGRAIIDLMVEGA